MEGEQITLNDGSSNVIDDLTYDDNSTWGSGADGLGSSLETYFGQFEIIVMGVIGNLVAYLEELTGRANRSISITGDAGFRMLSSPVSGQVLGEFINQRLDPRDDGCRYNKR